VEEEIEVVRGKNQCLRGKKINRFTEIKESLFN